MKNTDWAVFFNDIRLTPCEIASGEILRLHRKVKYAVGVLRFVWLYITGGRGRPPLQYVIAAIRRGRHPWRPVRISYRRTIDNRPYGSLNIYGVVSFVRYLVATSIARHKRTQGRFSCVVLPIYFLILITYEKMMIVNIATVRSIKNDRMQCVYGHFAY